jgi:hypothetical protein
MLAAQHIEDKAGDHQGGHHGRYIQNAAQTLPALALRVVEDLPVGHECFWLTPGQKLRKKGHSTRQLTAPAYHRQGAQLLEMPYAIQYESYGS